jgi:drug/metabolite transporter (DMT)-like permease
MQSRRLVGIGLALVSAVFFALANTLAGVAYKGGSNPFTLSATRFVLPALLLFVILVFTRKSVVLAPRPALVATVLGVISVIYTFALLKAIELLPVTIAILIFYLFPILTAFMLAALGAMRLTGKTVLSAVIVFFGLSLALAVQFGELDTVGMLAGLVSAVGFAVVCAASNRLMAAQDSRVVTMYLSVAATIAMIVVSPFATGIQFPVTTAGWWGFLLSNLLYAAAIIGFYRSIAMVGAGAATFFLNLEPIVVIGLGYILLGQTISWWQAVGVVIVVVALVYASQPEKPSTLTAPSRPAPLRS